MSTFAEALAMSEYGLRAAMETDYGVPKDTMRGKKKLELVRKLLELERGVAKDDPDEGISPWFANMRAEEFGERGRIEAAELRSLGDEWEERKKTAEKEGVPFDEEKPRTLGFTSTYISHLFNDPPRKVSGKIVVRHLKDVLKTILPEYVDPRGKVTNENWQKAIRIAVSGSFVQMTELARAGEIQGSIDGCSVQGFLKICASYNDLPMFKNAAEQLLQLWGDRQKYNVKTKKKVLGSLRELLVAVADLSKFNHILSALDSLKLAKDNMGRPDVNLGYYPWEVPGYGAKAPSKVGPIERQRRPVDVSAADTTAPLGEDEGTMLQPPACAAGSEDPGPNVHTTQVQVPEIPEIPVVEVEFKDPSPVILPPPADPGLEGHLQSLRELKEKEAAIQEQVLKVLEAQAQKCLELEKRHDRALEEFKVAVRNFCVFAPEDKIQALLDKVGLSEQA